MRVEACPKCASLHIGMATLRDGLVAGGGEGMLSVCRDCGYRGMPIRFDDAEEYARFRAEMPDAVPLPEAAAEPRLRRASDRWVAWSVLLAGAAFLGMGLLTLARGAVFVPEGGGLLVYSAPFVLLGAGLILAAWRMLN